MNFTYYGILFEKASSIEEKTNKHIFNIIFSNPDVDDIFLYDMSSDFNTNNKTIIVVRALSNLEAMNLLQKDYHSELEVDKSLIKLKEIFNNK